MTTIEPHVDVRAFFRDKVLDALQRQNLEIEDLTEYYLVNLLAEFAAGEHEEALLSQPLAYLLRDALEASGWDRLRRFRHLGDAALFVAGFFADNLERRGVSPRYVSSMGGQAYWTARSLARQTRARRSLAATPEVYAELADKFDVFVAVLDDIRETTSMRTPEEIVRLYQRWQRTRSPRLARRLQRQGVFPQLPGTGDSTLH